MAVIEGNDVHKSDTSTNILPVKFESAGSDLARGDVDGFYYITGRKKDLNILNDELAQLYRDRAAAAGVRTADPL